MNNHKTNIVTEINVVIKIPFEKINAYWFQKKLNNGVVCLFNPFVFEIIFVKNRDLIPTFINQDRNEKEIIEKKIKQNTNKEITTTYILPSYLCNNDCKYCHLKSIPRKITKIDLSQEEAKKSLKLFFDLAGHKKEKEVVIFGGEPLLNYSVTKFIVEYSQRFPNTSITIFTNGTKLTQEMSSFFAENNVFIIVSMDGLKEIQDNVRSYNTGKSNFLDTIKGYFLAQGAGCKLGISMQVGTHNIDNIFQTVSDMYDYFTPIEFGIGCNFHPLGNQVNPYQLDSKEVVTEIMKIYDEFKEKGVYIEQIVRRVRALINKTIKAKDCTAYGKKLVIVPGGEIGFCEYLAYEGNTFQSIENFSIDNNKEYDEWNTRMPLLNESCQDCVGLTICGGGCAYNAYKLYGSIHEKDIENCNQTLLILDWMIDKLSQKINKNQFDNDGFYIVTDENRKSLLGTIDLEDENLPLKLVSTVGEDYF